MGLVVIKEKLQAQDFQTAREEYEFYIKITVDLRQKIVVIGGEYHADAEEILVGNYSSKRQDIWGGGLNLKTKIFETNAVINLRQPDNPSMEILNLQVREKFLVLCNQMLRKFEEFL